MKYNILILSDFKSYDDLVARLAYYVLLTLALDIQLFLPYLSFLFQPIMLEYLRCILSDNKMIPNSWVQPPENVGPSRDPVGMVLWEPAGGAKHPDSTISTRQSQSCGFWAAKTRQAGVEDRYRLLDNRGAMHLMDI